MNVSDLGWAGGPYTLIARIPSVLLGREMFIAKPTPFLGFAVLLSRLDGTNDVPDFLLTYGVSGGFPYGANAEPDH